MKLPRAVETDNFESASESHERTKRKRKAPKRLDDSDSESDVNNTQNVLSSPPKIYLSKKHKKDTLEKNKKVKNNQDVQLGRSSSGNSMSTIDFLPKQNSSNSVEKSPFLQNTSPSLISKLVNKRKNKPCYISNDFTSCCESSTTTSEMNFSNNFDNVNYEKYSLIFSKAYNVEYLNLIY